MDEPPPPSPALAEDGSLARVLSGHEQREALAAMREAAGPGPTAPVDKPRRVPARWSDVPLAASYACSEVEAAVMATVAEPPRAPIEYRFRIKTIEGWPGELVVRRREEPEVYEASATIGRFPEEPSRAERAERLLEALHEQMAAFGAKRRYAD